MLTMKTRVSLWLTIACVGLLVACVNGQEKKSDAPRRLYLDEFRPKAQLRAPEHPLTRAKFPCAFRFAPVSD